MSTEIRGVDYINSENSEVWTIKRDGRYMRAIREYLIDDGIPEDSVDEITNNAVNTLGYCPNPKGEAHCAKTGIVIGKVQSGKTSTFISITALAFDNGYDIVVVFGGTKKPLVKQNHDRIEEYFKRAEDVIVLDTTEYREQLTEKNICQFIKMGRKIVIVVLKSPAQINYVAENVFDDELTNSPTLIIDDEGDEASLNTLVNKNKKSSTYRAIESMKNRVRKHCFISVTATPQANILIDTLDILSPDFGVLVDPGKGYCGLDVFHGDEKYTMRIPENEQSLLDEGIPLSFETALSMFFVACAISKQRGKEPGEKLSMLIHPSQLKADHKKVFDKLCNMVKEWEDTAKNRKDIAYKSLRNKLINAYNVYQKDIETLPKFELLEDNILEAISYCGKHIVNGDSVSNGADKFYDFNIYVGGTMLGRGLTLKGLAVTYIIRTAKGVSNADTVQQRARWFGYKNKYIDICRVFATGKIIKEFLKIRDHEEDLWETIREANLQGRRFKEMARIFVLDDQMRMTRGNVAKTDKFAFYRWNKQRVFLDNEEYISSNKSIIDGFYSKNVNDLKEIRIGSGAPYVILPGLSFYYIKSELLDKFIFPLESTLNNALIDKLSVLLKRKGINPLVDVIWMRYGETSKHSVVCGHIPNYFVGRRPKDEDRPITYSGDDNHFLHGDFIQLQIHIIEDTNTGIISPTLSLFIPTSIAEKLSGLVIKEKVQRA